MQPFSVDLSKVNISRAPIISQTVEGFKGLLTF